MEPHGMAGRPASLYIFSPQVKDSATPANEEKVGEADVITEPEQYPVALMT